MTQVQVPISISNGDMNPNGNPFATTSLYVGDLDPNVTDTQVSDLFKRFGQVVSVKICKDIRTQRSLGYAYVNYSNAEEAARALDELNFTLMNGKPIRIMYSHRDPSNRKSGSGNIFIKNLDKAIDNKSLHDTFSIFGKILSCKIATDLSGQSKGHGFVQFEKEEAAQSAINQLNGMLLNDKQVYVGPFVRKQEREISPNSTKFNNLYVKNLSESMSDEDLKVIFGEYGTITSAVVMKDEVGKSKCFGFVNFENSDAALRAVECLNGKKFDDKEWYVGKAQKKSERERELKSHFDQTRKEISENFQGLNLYLKNLDDSIDEEKLKDIFSKFGTITSCKVVRDSNAVSTGSGFVAFSDPEEASRALTDMHGKVIVSKPLYVAIAQLKEDRKVRLQAHFSQIRPVSMTPVAPPVPGYPNVGPGPGQHFFYGQSSPTMIPPQGFGFQHPLVPGMRSGGTHNPNFFVPLLQSQHAQHIGGRRMATVPGQQIHQPVTLSQQQLLSRGHISRYTPEHNIPDVTLSSAVRDSGPTTIATLASALAHATPDQQRTMLGENLYPLVEEIEHDFASKVTGMLLEMDQTEVLHLLESPDALKTKVAEAMEVLRSVSKQQHNKTPTDQLVCLSLK